MTPKGEGGETGGEGVRLFPPFRNVAAHWAVVHGANICPGTCKCRACLQVSGQYGVQEPGLHCGQVDL